MPIRWLEDGQVLTAQIIGEIDHHAARQMMEEVGEQIDLVLPKELRMDMDEVTFMDSSGIALVLRAWKRMSGLGGVTALYSVPTQAEKVLKAAGVDKLIPLVNQK